MGRRPALLRSEAALFQLRAINDSEEGPQIWYCIAARDQQKAGAEC